VKSVQIEREVGKCKPSAIGKGVHFASVQLARAECMYIKVAKQCNGRSILSVDFAPWQHARGD
jgi:hypothetical protein